MLTSSFVHLPGIGRRSEERLWLSGIKTWRDLAAAIDPDRLLFDHRASLVGHRRLGEVHRELERSEAALDALHGTYFADRLPRSEHWRLLREFEPKTVYLDIETTGLSRYYDEVTLVGWRAVNGYDARISGHDLHELEGVLDGYEVVVTFNGATFDLPFLRQKHPELRLPPIQIDLRYVLRRLGLAGGLKAIEAAVGLRRLVSEGFDGRRAVSLWFRYLRGEPTALRELLEYNYEDTASLVSLARYAYGQQVAAVVGADAEGVSSMLPLPTPAGEVSKLWEEAARSGPPRARFTVEELLDLAGNQARAVGIDLTGSEAKPSGWALLDGREVTTARIRSDRELVEATLAARPDVVSIDSPLSVPPGTEIGENGQIVRYQRAHRDSELELRRRGVHLYWCLIPSMQALTLRGMRLAEVLRSYGLPVIESYPGGAQDILGLPRKQAGVDELRRSLAAIGLSGVEKSAEALSHDELDAVTSALVGLFYLGGSYEALGNETSDLIVPRLQATLLEDGKNG